MSLTIIISVVAVFIVFMLIMGIGSLMQSGSDKAERRVKSRLKALAMSDVDPDIVDLVLRETSMSEVPLFNRLLESMRWSARFSRLMYQADAKGSAGAYLLACALLAVIGFYVGTFSGRVWVSLAATILLGYIPLWRLQSMKRKRMDQFQKQLPEALDLMARALKAGHTFGGGMRMVANEFDAPIGPEFGKTLDEINYGMNVDRALANLQKRVDCPDLKFFVVSVNIQRETGGNLAEIIAKIASLVRERFALFGKIKILSAEGRISAYILVALPFVLGGILYAVNPDYVSLLWTRELGQNMTWGAVISMVFGSIIISRIIKIKV
ncbi:MULTISPECIES: type II secretion system F family protein [unclassified Pseudodesulfovibrio]|uniref:type II secretion system F family protein n=1 Tax=unclassified Pseudodesulfovibrio TaxID=2661612 RepID=UPI000FEBB09B|nr:MULTISPECIES: type II secretion system F family protein [unclassified Pseudodesulfovibrio]MCJ2164430.1 type II secretion system F family protein [Pseudodesulfovibrio sp. S3-i]RWU04635.1 type II secretion protein F [Pseudodesulfovibrio sp. S3]